ncbi:hypothetical protein [Azospirillum palustre]
MINYFVRMFGICVILVSVVFYIVFSMQYNFGILGRFPIDYFTLSEATLLFLLLYFIGYMIYDKSKIYINRDFFIIFVEKKKVELHGNVNLFVRGKTKCRKEEIKRNAKFALEDALYLLSVNGGGELSVSTPLFRDEYLVEKRFSPRSASWISYRTHASAYRMYAFVLGWQRNLPTWKSDAFRKIWAKHVP